MVDPADTASARALGASQAASRSKAHSSAASALRQFARTVVLAWGWKRAAIAFGAGALSTLALAPFNAWPLLFLTFPILVWLIDGTDAGPRGFSMSAAIVGWWFGFGYFLSGLYWVGIAFLVDAPTFGWLMPLAVVGLPAGLAILTACGTMLARFFWSPDWTRIIALAAALTLAEYLRGHILTGFPWNAYGYALSSSLVLAQFASVAGLWGLTFIAVAVFAAPATLTDDRVRPPMTWLPTAAGVCVLAALALFGWIRLATTPTTFVDGVRLRIMQPNLSQDAKFKYAAKQDVMARYLALSDRATGPDNRGVKDVTHLIWPESAFPFLLTREADALAQIAELLPAGTVLITGAARAEPAPNGTLQALNSIYVLDDKASVVALYDKVHLVPFGEYLPFQSFLERLGLQQLTKVRGGFIAGDRRRPLNVPGMPPALPLICYEIIFPGQIAPAGERPGWLLNLTNDGWFGNSTGPYQHFQQARLRTIEEGLPLVRAANTGISAVVDPLGRVIRMLPLGVEAVIDAPLPQRLNAPLFRVFGDNPALGGIFIAFAYLIWRRPANNGRGR
jgi:apolipoprotein N-acyltransferase